MSVAITSLLSRVLHLREDGSRPCRSGAVFALLLAAPSFAFALPADRGGAHISGPSGPETAVSAPDAPRSRRVQLEGLFAALKAAPDRRGAEIIADRLEQMFDTTSSASVDLLLARASVALEGKDHGLALKILDQVLDIDPDEIGARAKRATLHYMAQDYGAALADMREVLAREPRHFSMLYGLALILRDLGEDRRALDAVRRALAVNPRFEEAKELESQLAVRVEGRDI